jgi:hypothetical protein
MNTTAAYTAAATETKIAAVVAAISTAKAVKVLGIGPCACGRMGCDDIVLKHVAVRTAVEIATAAITEGGRVRVRARDGKITVTEPLHRGRDGWGTPALVVFPA